MAVTTIARIQHRRGARSDLPTALYEGELGWCLDTRELFIGNGAPFDGNTQILTAQSPSDQIVKHIWRPWSGTYTAAVERSIGSKMDDVVSIADFGVVGDGVTDVTDMINNALGNLLAIFGPRSVAEQAAAMTIRFPAGTYVLTGPVLLWPYLNIMGDGVGNTVFQLFNPAVPAMFITSDSLGQVFGATGSNNAILPSNITMSNCTISTGGLKANAILASRYRNIKLHNVEFVGGYVTGDEAVVSPHAAVTLATIGAGIDIYGFHITDCQFRDFTYGIMADEPVLDTAIINSWFEHCWKGIALGLTNPSDPGPLYVKVSNSTFKQSDSVAVHVEGGNSNVSSSGNTFIDCDLADFNDGITLTTNFQTLSGNTLYFADTTGILLGTTVSGPHIPSGTTVTVVNPTDVGISNAVFETVDVGDSYSFALPQSIKFVANSIDCTSISDIFSYSLADVAQPVEFSAGKGHILLDPQQSNLVGTGTVTSVGLTATGMGLTVSNSPITSSGAIALGGTLNVAHGGTGQTTASAAFNALSPITSTGDLIIGNGVNSATRLPIGANTYVLTSNGTTATWAAPSGGGGGGTNIRYLTVATTGTYTANPASDDVIVVNRGSVGATTINLPVAPATGLTFTIKDGKGDAATNNTYIVPAAGQVDGQASVTLNVNYAAITVIYDGSSWRVI
jgi:Pectate lyase superfamily protein/Major tropism determinant N-terminal domain